MMSDKLQFVDDERLVNRFESLELPNHDKLKFVGHYERSIDSD
jgi:hypothetical protein